MFKELLAETDPGPV